MPLSDSTFRKKERYCHFTVVRANLRTIIVNDSNFCCNNIKSAEYRSMERSDSLVLKLTCRSFMTHPCLSKTKSVSDFNYVPIMMIIYALGLYNSQAPSKCRRFHLEKGII